MDPNNWLPVLVGAFSLAGLNDMSGGAAGGFVTRAFESMLKECSGKKYPDLQKAIQSYLGSSALFHASLCHVFYLKTDFARVVFDAIAAFYQRRFCCISFSFLVVNYA